jgi:phosphoribulokinase
MSNREHGAPAGVTSRSDALMARPVILGIVGDSASGKTTLSKGLVRLLGEEVVTHICTDDYHKYDRKQRAERAITPLDPDCNYLDIMASHLKCLHDGHPILKPVYQHHNGTFGPLVYVEPEPFAVVEGLLGYYTEEMRENYDVRVYLDPPESLRRQWKVDRDCSRRGYTTDQVLDDLDRREPDSAAYIRPQRVHADMVVCRQPNADDPFVLDAVLTLRDSLPHPDLSPFVDGNGNGAAFTMEERHGERVLHIPGDLERERAAEIEEAIWDRMHFASHLRSDALGEFTVGTDVHRSESLALVQLLILYHLTMARATVALGGEPDNGK